MLRTLLFATAFAAAYAVAISPRVASWSPPPGGEDITDLLGDLDHGQGSATRRKSLPPEEIDILARTLLGEGSRQGDRELEALTHVIVNRLRAGTYGATVTDVVTFRKCRGPGDCTWAFSCMDKVRAQPDRNVWADHLPRTRAYRRMVEIIERVWQSDSDPTRGAVQYFHPKAMLPANSEPRWAVGKPKIQIGEAIFLPRETKG